MKPRFSMLLRATAAGLLMAALLSSAGRLRAQAAANKNEVSALLLSDLHFDPFHDPAKTPRLAAAPAEEWEAILAGPASADQAKTFAALQQSCHARGVDTPYALLRSSLAAMREKAPHAAFLTVSGDLIAHDFDCRYQTLMPGRTAKDYEAFVEKTLRYLVGRLKSTYPDVPIYIALGNNDSGCGDYRMDAQSDFLAATGKILAEGLPPEESGKAEADFEAEGSYSVPMAAPMRDTRLIVLNSIFLSGKYETCAGAENANAVSAELAWLEKQLAAARAAHQKVWVMAHIPPGVDLYTTFVHFTNVCGGAPPAMFLSSEKMADLLASYADVVRLMLLGHTHMDELRLLTAEDGSHSVAVKLVPSISPVNGNNPAFTAASIDAATATLLDYRVYAASNQTGAGTAWSKEYAYSEAYRQAAFSPAALEAILNEFKADPEAKGAASQAYVRNYFVSGPGGGQAGTSKATAMLKSAWPLYVCSLDRSSAKGFAACVCSGGK